MIGFCISWSAVPKPLFYDREVSPSSVQDVARATLALLEKSAPFGTYYCVNAGHANWLTVAEHIMGIGGFSGRLVPVSVKTTQLRAARPRYAALMPEKLAQAAFQMPP